MTGEALPSEAGVDPEALDRLRAGFQSDIDRKRHYGGTLLVARKGRIVFHEGIGHLDPQGETAAHKEARYCNMSLSKAYAAGVVLHLIDAGHLTLSSKVTEFLPEYGVRGKSETEIFHLMNHTGGLWGGFGPPPPAAFPDSFDLSKSVPALCQTQVEFRPGTQVSYTPMSSHSILGEIAQRITGKKFADLAQEILFAPLGMTDTQYGLNPDHPNHVRIRMADHNPGAATVDTMEGLNNLMTDGRCLPGGSVFATAKDVFRFAEMQRRGGTLDGYRFLSPALTRYATQNSTGSMTNRFWDFSKIDRGIAEFPANFSLFGGYVRGKGHFLTPLGETASETSFGAVGSGSTMYMVDPARELVFVLLSAGLTEGLGHFQDMSRLADLAIAACNE